MGTVVLGLRSRAEAVAGIAIIVVCPVVAALAVLGGTTATLAVAGVVALALGVYVGLSHPLWLYWGMAAVLGMLPFGYFPGVHLPLYLPFAAGALLAALIHPSEHKSFHPVEKVVVLLVLTSALSLIFTGRTLTDIAEYIKWTITTLVVVALLRLSRENMARFGRIYVYAATANALFGIAVVAADPNQRFIKIFGIFGYGRVDTARFVFADEGQSRFARLGGTWVDPNMAGIGLVIALVLAVVLLTGKLRAAVMVILTVAILLTLSRAAIFTVLVGIALVLAFHGMRARDRKIAFGTIALVTVGAFVIPAIRHRIFSSFGSEDIGTSSRLDAIANWPGQMAGHWPFGLGWGRPEFKSGQTAFTLNFVANVPLLTIYRAGIIVGMVMIVLLALGCVVGARALRSDSLPYALYGGVFIGVVFVALQLDHMVVDIPQVTLMFSVLLAFLVYVDQDRTSPRHAMDRAPTLAAAQSN
jgi:polysaccharide biosynthesis protein PslJ